MKHRHSIYRKRDANCLFKRKQNSLSGPLKAWKAGSCSRLKVSMGVQGGVSKKPYICSTKGPTTVNSVLPYKLPVRIMHHRFAHGQSGDTFS